MSIFVMHVGINTFRLRQNGRHFTDKIFKCIFLNENVWISLKFSLKFVPKGPINNIPALVQIMAWRLPGDKPLSEPMMTSFPTHICITRPQWVKKNQLCTWLKLCDVHRDHTRYVPNQCKTSLLCNNVSHWFGTITSQWQMSLHCNNVSH